MFKKSPWLGKLPDEVVTIPEYGAFSSFDNNKTSNT
jgi:hypothetical protein